MVKQLHNKGIITDEEDFGLASPAMKHCHSIFDKVFREHGYMGGTIECAGVVVNGGIAIYALYDSSMFDPITSRYYLNEFAKRNPEHYL